jgi:hypothetical protein
MFGAVQQICILGVTYVYLKMYQKFRLQPDSKVPCLINAIVCSAGSASCYLFPSTVECFIVLFYGYIYWDLGLNVWEYKKIRDPACIVHHALFTMGLYLVPRDECVFDTVWWLLAGELSTIFLQTRNILKANNLTQGRMYSDVSKLFVVTFIPTRVFLFGWGLLDTWRNCYLSVFLVLCPPYFLNLYWSYLIVKKSIHHITNGSDRTVRDDSE